MTSKEFILWLKGFTEGVHEFNITPKQWDTLKDKLAEINDNVIPMGGIITDHNTFKTIYPNWTGNNPYGTTITTTPGYGSITTSTATSLPSGSTINYTNGVEDEVIKTHNED